MADGRAAAAAAAPDGGPLPPASPRRPDPLRRFSKQGHPQVLGLPLSRFLSGKPDGAKIANNCCNALVHAHLTILSRMDVFNDKDY